MTNTEIKNNLNQLLSELKSNKEKLESLHGKIEAIPAYKLQGKNKELIKINESLQWTEDKQNEVTHIIAEIDNIIQNFVAREERISQYTEAINNNKTKGNDKTNKLIIDTLEEAKQINIEALSNDYAEVKKRIDDEEFYINMDEFSQYEEMVRTINDNVNTNKRKHVNNSKKAPEKVNKKAKGISAKIIAIILAGVLVIGGIAEGIKAKKNAKSDNVLESTPPAITIVVPTPIPSSDQVNNANNSEEEQDAEIIGFSYRDDYFNKSVQKENELVEKIGTKLYEDINDFKVKSYNFDYSKEEVINMVSDLRNNFSNLPETKGLNGEEKEQVYLQYYKQMLKVLSSYDSVYVSAVLDNIYNGTKYEFTNPNYSSIFENENESLSKKPMKFKGIETLNLYETLYTDLCNATTNKNWDKFKEIGQELVALTSALYVDNKSVFLYDGVSIDITCFGDMNPAVQCSCLIVSQSCMNILTSRMDKHGNFAYEKLTAGDKYEFTDPCITAGLLRDLLNEGGLCGEKGILNDYAYWDMLYKNFTRLIAERDALNHRDIITNSESLSKKLIYTNIENC